MNRGSVRTQAADFCGDKNQTRYSATQYNTAINRAQEQFALDTKALFKDTSWSTVSGTATYDLPDDFMWEDWVTYDGSEISPISRHELQRRKGGEDWTDDTGTPTHYIVDPEVAQGKVRLYPIPQEAKTLGMRYFPLPAEMTSDSDTPLNSTTRMAQFHIALAAYAAWLLLTGEDPTPSIDQKRSDLMKIYADGAGKATETFKNTASAPIMIKGTFIWR